MPHIANNADDYASSRQNIFFPGVTSDLDGQCVSLVKWFMQEMSDVPNPQAPRGDARYIGQTLVAQGQAIAVPYSERRRGDIICYEVGTYGHIAVQLSGGRVFEENVNMGGVQSEVVAGSTVYASRIGSENESWRASFNPHIYRLNSYNETGVDTMAKPTYKQVLDAFNQYGIGVLSEEQQNYYVANDIAVLWLDLLNFNTDRLNEQKSQVNSDVTSIGQLNAQVKDLTGKLAACQANNGGGFTEADRTTLNWIQKAIASIFKIPA